MTRMLDMMSKLVASNDTMPSSAVRYTPANGNTVRKPSCRDNRTSLTLEDIITFTSMLIIAEKGAKSRRIAPVT